MPKLAHEAPFYRSHPCGAPSLVLLGREICFQSQPSEAEGKPVGAALYSGAALSGIAKTHSASTVRHEGRA